MRTKVLVVDEISMLDKHVFEVLDQIARQLKELDEPFGGMQVLVVGDFMQLPPVNKDRRKRSEFCFESPVWKEAGLNDVKGRVTVVMMVMMMMCTSSIWIVYLKKIERQKDEEFVTLLNQVRLGETSHTLMVVMMMMMIMMIMIMMMVVVIMVMMVVVMMVIMVVVMMMMVVMMMIMVMMVVVTMMMMVMMMMMMMMAVIMMITHYIIIFVQATSHLSPSSCSTAVW